MSSEKKHCLKDELFNLVLDGEYEFSSDDLAHLDSCEACRQRYSELRTLHLLLSNCWEIPTKDFSAASIRFNVHRKLAEEKRNSFFRNLRPLGIAAGVLIALGAALLLSDLFNPVPKINSSEYSFNIAAANEADDYPYYPTRPAIMNNRNALSRQLAVSQFGTLPIDQLIPVDSRRSNTVLAYIKDLLASRQEVLANIDANVSHVWVTSNTEQAAADLSKLIEILQLQEKCRWTTDEKGEIHLTADLTKGKLLQLVRAARWYDWDLLSPQAPQPENSIPAAIENEPVHYEMSIVESF